MPEIRFQKIEIEKEDLNRLETIVKRFEDAARIVNSEEMPDDVIELNNIIVRQEREIRHIRQKYIKLLGFCHDWNIAYEKLYNELLQDDYDNG